MDLQPLSSPFEVLELRKGSNIYLISGYGFIEETEVSAGFVKLKCQKFKHAILKCPASCFMRAGKLYVRESSQIVHTHASLTELDVMKLRCVVSLREAVTDRKAFNVPVVDLCRDLRLKVSTEPLHICKTTFYHIIISTFQAINDYAQGNVTRAKEASVKLSLKNLTASEY
jgi:hypothetical protein